VIATPVAIHRLNETECAYERAAEKAFAVIREAGVPLAVKCTPNGMVYIDSIHNGSSPKLLIAIVDPTPVDRPAYREHHLEEDLREHAIKNRIDSGQRPGRWSSRYE
jgi:hypothetical protein